MPTLSVIRANGEENVPDICVAAVTVFEPTRVRQKQRPRMRVHVCVRACLYMCVCGEACICAFFCVLCSRLVFALTKQHVAGNGHYSVHEDFSALVFDIDSSNAKVVEKRSHGISPHLNNPRSPALISSVVAPKTHWLPSYLTPDCDVSARALPFSLFHLNPPCDSFILLPPLLLKLLPSFPSSPPQPYPTPLLSSLVLLLYRLPAHERTPRKILNHIFFYAGYLRRTSLFVPIRRYQLVVTLRTEVLHLKRNPPQHFLRVVNTCRISAFLHFCLSSWSDARSAR